MASEPQSQSVLGTVEGVVKSLVTLSAEGLAQALGLITAARAAISTVASGVAAAATMGTVNAANAKYQQVPLTPAILADMVVRNVLAGPGVTPGQALVNSVDGNTATQEAALSGLDAARFEAMVLDTGESYGIIDALRLYNRGQYMYSLVPSAQYATGVPIYQPGENLAGTYGITEQELNRVIYYSRVRDQFIPDLLKLAKSTLSPADAVEMAVKQIVPQDVAKSLFEAAGGVGEQFDALVDAAGDSAGVVKIAELRSHGVITEGQALQAVGMSRLNPRFYYLTEPGDEGIIPFNRKWLPIFELRTAVETGVIDQATALQWMHDEGYSTEQSRLFLAASAVGALQNPKAESMAVILSEYSSHMLTQEQATTALQHLGYVAESVPFLLQYAQSKQVISARTAAIARTRMGYLLGLVSNDQATVDLSQVGVPQAAITSLLEDWAVELSVPHTALTTAQIGKLLKDSNIDTAKAEQLWRMRGYTAEDVGYLLMIYPAPVQATPPKFVTGAKATVTVGRQADITITATGSPAPSIMETGTIPDGMLWETPVPGTARIVGTPAAGTEGTVTLQLEAVNGSPTPAIQTFVLTVAPA